MGWCWVVVLGCLNTVSDGLAIKVLGLLFGF